MFFTDLRREIRKGSDFFYATVGIYVKWVSFDFSHFKIFSLFFHSFKLENHCIWSLVLCNSSNFLKIPTIYAIYLYSDLKYLRDENQRKFTRTKNIFNPWYYYHLKNELNVGDLWFGGKLLGEMTLMWKMLVQFVWSDI